MAKAVGVTEKELAAMMKSGQLLADEASPQSLLNIRDNIRDRKCTKNR
jgi:hypothetical protein